MGEETSEVFKQAYAIDGLKFSDPNDSKHCQLRPGGKKKDVVIDGPKGEDNSFGKNVVPILFGLQPDLNIQVDGAVAAGEFGLVLRVEGLGTKDTYFPLATELFSVVGPVDGSGQRIPVGDWSTYGWQPLSEVVDTVDADGVIHAHALSEGVSPRRPAGVACA